MDVLTGNVPEEPEFANPDPDTAAILFIEEEVPEAKIIPPAEALPEEEIWETIIVDVGED